MNPEVSLIKAVEVLPSQIGHQQKGSVVLMPKSKGPLRAKRGRPRTKPIVTASVGTVAAPDAGPAEAEDQKRAFDFYLLLGKERSIQKVADYFTVNYGTVSRWCRLFRWKRRVLDIANRSGVEKIRTNIIDRLVLDSENLIKSDPERRGKRIANDEFSQGKLKEMATTYKIIRDVDFSANQDKRDMETGPRGPGTSGRNRGGLMVNVVIQK